MAGRILIVDDVATNRIVLRVKLAAACYQIVQASTGAEALERVSELRPDLVLLELDLPDMDGLAVCRALKAEPATRSLPVVVVSARHDTASKLEALQAGAEDVLPKPLDEVVLLARLRSLMRARETEEELRLRDSTNRALGFREPGEAYEAGAEIGLVAADRTEAARWKRQLAPGLASLAAGLTVLGPEATLRDGLPEPRGGRPARAPELFLIAADLGPPGAGLRLMSELRARPATRHAAICIMLPPAVPRSPARQARLAELTAMALDLGASDVLSAEACGAEMALRLQRQLRRKRQADRLRAQVADGLRLAVIDPLTGLYNRRYALPHVARLAERARRLDRPFAVMILDLDRFKLVNDGWGHAAGDAVLIEVARRLRDNLRAVDMVARLGGEEFLVTLPDTGQAGAELTAERLRRVIEAEPVTLAHGAGPVPVTVSIGLAMGHGRSGRPTPVEDLLDRADLAMLGSKAEGRNLVTISRPAA